MPDRLDVGLPLFTLGTAYQIPRMNAGATAPEWATLSGLLDALFGADEGTLIRRGNSAWQAVSKGAENTIFSANATTSLFQTLSTLIDGALGSTRGSVLRRGSGGWEIVAPGTSGYVLTSSGAGADPDWNALATTPSADLWGSNARLLSGNITLTASDETIQSIDPGGAARTVTLSSPATATTPLFFILNRGTTSAQTIKVLDQEGNLLVTLTPSQATWCLNDLARWWALGPFTAPIGAAIDVGYQVFSYATDPSATGNRLNVRGAANSAPTGSADNVASEYVCTEAGVIDRVEFAYEINGSNIWDLRINGSVTDQMTVASGDTAGGYFAKRFDLNRSVASGDKVSLSLNTNTSDLGDIKARVYVRAAAGKGMSLFWASTTPGAGQHVLPDAQSGQGSTSATLDYTTEHMAPQACSDVALFWHSTSADSTTVVKVVKNGAVVDTITLTGVAGRAATVGTSYVAGDGIALEFDAGTNPAAWHLGLELDIQGVESLRWGGDSSANNGYLHAFSIQTQATSATTATQEHEVIMPYACSAQNYTFQSSSATNAGFSLRKNGAIDQTITPAAAEETGSLTATFYGAGDRIGITMTNSTAPAVRVQVLVRPINET